MKAYLLVLPAHFQRLRAYLAATPRTPYWRYQQQCEADFEEYMRLLYEQKCLFHELGIKRTWFGWAISKRLN